jgi:hypothetical protein
MAIYWNRSWSSVTESWGSAVGNWGSVGYEPAVANLVITGYAPNIPLSIAVGTADLTVTGYIPITVEDMPHPIPASADLVLTGYAPLTVENIPIFPPRGDIAISSTAPGGGISYYLTVENGEIVVTGIQPIVVYRNPQFLPPIQII